VRNSAAQGDDNKATDTPTEYTLLSVRRKVPQYISAPQFLVIFRSVGQYLEEFPKTSLLNLTKLQMVDKMSQTRPVHMLFIYKV
jgi:hypothetical protein